MTAPAVRARRGQILLGAVIVMAALLIIVPVLVSWVQQNVRMAVKDSQNTTAFNLAEAAVNRGYWTAKSSTAAIAAALAGQPISGCEFDAIYTDVPGGTYRIQITSAGSSSIQIVGEGRDSSGRQTRAIAAVYQNRTIYSPLLTQGDVSYKKGMCIYWGPIMSQGSVALDNTTSQWYWPRKFARSDVTGVSGYPRDTTWPLPPNTDNVEWWANYQYVPELPILDFTTLRASAAATNTLNVYGCASSSSHTDPDTGQTVSGNAPWDLNTSGGRRPRPYCPAGSPHTYHFGDSYNHPKGTRNDQTPYVWYWDGDLVLTGGNQAFGDLDTGLNGIVIVRGNLTIDSAGDYNFTNNVPADAWMDQEKLLINAYDTSATNEYPADDGLHKTLSSWNFGSSSFCQPGESCGWVNTVGIKGFVYVGGNLIINSFMDFNGAIWVNGSVAANCPSSDPNCMISFCGIFYDDSLQVPTLNVILVRTSWEEVPPSSTPWL